jgi:lipid export ABC transport protein
MGENMRDLIGVFKRFKSYYKDYYFEFTIAILGMILTAIGTASSAYLVKPVLDKIFIEKNENLLYLLPYAIIFVYFLKSLGTYLQAYFTAFIGQDIVRRFREKLLMNLLRQDIDFFNKMRSGELISRNLNDVERIKSVVAEIFPQLVRDLLVCIGLLGVVIYSSAHLAFFALIFIPVVIYPTSLIARKIKKISRSSQEKLSDLSSVLNQIFTNIELIKANNAQNLEFSNFKNENHKYFKFCLKQTKLGEIVSPMMELVGSLGIALTIIIGGKEVIEGKMSVGEFFSFLTALFMCYTPMKNITRSYAKIQDAVSASLRTFELLDKKHSIISGNAQFPEFANIVSFQDIKLQYGEKIALRGINLSVKKGEILALVGNSGGGKSSIVNLLMRFYDASSGNILINNFDIREFDLQSLRKNIGLVSQRIYIFNNTIAYNVAYGDKIDEERVISALKSANAWEFVSAYESGIYEILNEFGSNLSGGQRQRIAIARALYKNPQILIFDEATSALDNSSEELITQELQKLARDKILIIIAHRLSTIKNATNIAVISNGRVEGFGDEYTLSKNCEIYQKLKGTFAK